MVSTKPRLNELSYEYANFLFSKFLHNSLLQEIFDEKVLTFPANRLSEFLSFENCVGQCFVYKEQIAKTKNVEKIQTFVQKIRA